ADLNIQNDELITVKVGDHSITLPCYTMPGQARYSIGLVLGGGRTHSGRAAAIGGDRKGKNSPGFNTDAVRTSNGLDFATGATVTGGGGKYELANVQDHWNYKPGNQKLMGYGEFGGSFDPEVERRAEEASQEITNEELNKTKSWRAESEHEFWDDEVD